MLDRLATRQPQPRARVLVEDRAPDLRGELRVVRVAPVDLDEERPAVRVAGSSAKRPALCRSATVSPSASTPSSRRLPATRDASGRPDEVPNASLMVEAAATATRKPATVPPGVTSAAISTPSTPSATIHRLKRLEWTHELAVHGEHHRRRLGDEHRREARRSRPALDRFPDGGPVPDREPRRDERDDQGEHECRDRLESRRPSSRDETDDDENDRPETEHVVEEAPGRIEPVRNGGEEPVERALEPRGRVRDDEEHDPDRRHDERQDVGRPPEAGLPGRRREDTEAQDGLPGVGRRRQPVNSRNRW